MMSPHPLFGRMLEFNFFPSRTLHMSRYDMYALPGLPQAVQARPGWQAAWHRHWSKSILRMLNVGAIENTIQPELALGLLPAQALKKMAGRVGVALCGTSLRHTILGEQVRALKSALGDELLTFARRDVARYEADLAPWETVADVPRSLDGLETLGYGTMLAGLSQSGPELLRRVELKFPIDIRGTDFPLPAAQAWQLCLAILKDMDSAWCSFFPAAR